jgi:two-component system, NarL family, sensor kinase
MFINKFVFLLFISMFFSQNIFSQNKITDSLEGLLSIQKDTNLAATYNELTWQYRKIDKEKAIFYGNKAIEFATKIKYPKSVAQAYNDLGIIFFDKENYDSAILYYNKAIVIRREIKDELGIAKLYNKIGIVYQKQGIFDKSLENQFAALAIFEKFKNDFGISYSLNNIGILNQNLGRYNEAIDYHKKSLVLKQKINDKAGVAASYINIANIYLLSKDYINAETNYLDGTKLSRELNDNEYLANALNNLGNLYKTIKKNDKAIEVISESLQIRQQLKDSKGIVSCCDNLGNIYADKKEYAKADSIYKKALEIGTKAVNCLPEINKIYFSYAQLLEAKGDTSKAYQMFKLYSATKDSLYTNNVGNVFAELETKYKTLEQQEQIAKQQFEITKKNYWIFGFLMFSLLSILIAYLLYRRYQLKQQAKLHIEILHQQELSTKAVLDAEEHERKRIASDLHDGVGQTLSAAKMNLSALQNELTSMTNNQNESFEKVIQLVDESCKEVRSVSHNMMPNALLKMGLAQAIQSFINQINNNIIKIDLYTQGLNENIDSNTESVLYRIIQETVNNAIKHSGGNHLDISIIKDIDGLSVTIEDNGKGFDIKETNFLEGIGLKNIRSRVQFLKGTVEWQSQPQKGTLVAIHLPTNK